MTTNRLHNDLIIEELQNQKYKPINHISGLRNSEKK